jgi:hypothetical protein
VPDLVTETPLHWVLSYALLYSRIIAGAARGSIVKEE